MKVLVQTSKSDWYWGNHIMPSSGYLQNCPVASWMGVQWQLSMLLSAARLLEVIKAPKPFWIVSESCRIQIDVARALRVWVWIARAAITCLTKGGWSLLVAVATPQWWSTCRGLAPLSARSGSTTGKSPRGQLLRRCYLTLGSLCGSSSCIYIHIAVFRIWDHTSTVISLSSSHPCPAGYATHEHPASCPYTLPQEQLLTLIEFL